MKITRDPDGDVRLDDDDGDPLALAVRQMYGDPGPPRLGFWTPAHTMPFFTPEQVRDHVIPALQQFVDTLDIKAPEDAWPCEESPD